tara:strand:- start:3321 stop:3923 length:603 start_codon:yes stop_codon:yes gene_type:complete
LLLKFIKNNFIMISAILLAAGQSKRMNGENKLAKELEGTPLIKHSIINILNSSIKELVVVLGHQKEIIEKLIDKNQKTKIVFNRNFKDGMASSIKIGINSLSKNTKAFFISLGDMPKVDKDIYDKLIISRNTKKIVVPTFNGIQGNPVLFDISMKNKIMNLNGDTGAKKIIELNKNDTLYIETNNLGVSKDFNTKENFNS